MDETYGCLHFHCVAATKQLEPLFVAQFRESSDSPWTLLYSMGPTTHTRCVGHIAAALTANKSSEFVSNQFRIVEAKP